MSECPMIGGSSFRKRYEAIGETEKPMRPEELASAISEAFATEGIEEGHALADRLMTQQLRLLGYGEAADAFEKEDKYWA